jgi:ubiquinone/menaquinone biosynthesis C-methylase UbiE
MNSVDHSSHKEFYDYYVTVSQNPETLLRFRALRDNILRIYKRHGRGDGLLEVADIGCGAGTQSFVWAELGHKVHGLDVNEPLLELAQKRALAEGHQIDFRLGHSSKLPWPSESMDVCVVLELLEHVADWENCVRECARVVRAGGILLLTTTNKLCPFQQEFNLPLYSWYPNRVKRYFEKLAVSSRPDLANYATYPAVNWFTFYSLRDELLQYEFSCMDRFDIMDLARKNLGLKLAVSTIRAVPVLRWFAHVACQGTFIVALKDQDDSIGEHQK